MSKEVQLNGRAGKGQASGSASKNPGKQRFIFKTIAIALPFVFLLLVEIGLRIFDYGDSLELFIAAKGRPDYMVLNPNASKRYFIDQVAAPTGNSELFRRIKEKATVRIFILGESTTIGYPYFHNGSFHRWLLYRLMHEFPDKQFEVINLSLTAVNSYTIRGFAKGLIQYQPDAVLVYSGHNEYYGTLGVGAVNKIGSNPNFIKLVLMSRGLRIVQLLTNIFQSAKTESNLSKEYKGQTLMQRMVADQQIPFGSPLYEKGIAQFTSNMDETLKFFSDNAVPVFVSNVVSNEMDIKPFVSIQPDSIRFAGFKKNFVSGVSAFNSGDWKNAEQLLETADHVYHEHALCNYYLGKLAYQRGDYPLAKMYLIKAKDLDGLRFRAPSGINEVITKLCSKYPFAHLVDTKAAFDSSSVNHIIGSGLMLEHVHPNLMGYAIISNAFYEALKNGHIVSVAKDNEMSLHQLLQSMPITAVDSLTGSIRIAKLKRSWPFNEVLSADAVIPIATEEQKLADGIVNEHRRWPEAMEELYNYYLEKNDLSKAKTVMEAGILEHPTELYFYDKTANLDGRLGNYEAAAFYFKKAFAIAPGFEYARTLFVLYLKMDRPNDAMPYLNYAIQHNMSNVNFLPVRKYAGEIIDLQKEVARDSSNLPVLNLIATTYLTMGNKEGASKYAAMILKTDPKNKEALAVLEQIKKG